ncbi:XdhC family protein [Candidatus Thiothrix sp. Deng01]|uniref:XdhC family protein n=1 Tax=Candidatus Thiothrix phosphatis TaxID=3112415 RepID=A0ABU6D4L3_9GAMM|nr:XdhC family protein [Candidatus Thiothrix sp. Deng01]MEB4593238.1 XdhC family protein [Candidatus Thiothrix sp. Deng01]
MLMQSDTVLDRAASLKAEGKPFALVTVVRCEAPISARPGAKAVVDSEGNIDGWIGGGCAQPAVIDTVKKALQDGQARLIRISPTRDAAGEEGIIDFGMTCHSGGMLEIFIDPVVPRPMLLIIGASPAARSLAVLASRAGFAVTVAFPDVDAEMFPDADKLLNTFEASQLQGYRSAFVVVATQGKRDEAGLEFALATEASYIACIASRRKAEKLRAYLKERGHDAKRVDAIIAPAGLDIGAVSSEEIAVSVLAGVIQARHPRNISTVQTGKKVELPVWSPVSVQAKPVYAQIQAVESSGHAIDPVCGMRVAMAGAEFTAEYQGTRYFFCCAGCQHSFEKSPEQYLETEASSA